jgi:hypothetical protein
MGQMPVCTNKANSPGGAGLSCTNKPNLACPGARRRVTVNKQSQLAGGTGRDAVRLYKQTQFGGARPRGGVPLRTNKDKLGRPGVSGGPARGGSLSCKTKPIFAAPVGKIPHCSTILSFHHSNPMPIVRNEPNLRGRIAQNEANFRPALPGKAKKWASDTKVSFWPVRSKRTCAKNLRKSAN